MNETDLASWQAFAVATMGAAAALLGLIFVSISIHLRRVMESPELRGRARGTISGLLLIVLIGLVLLVPGQPAGLVGLEMLVAGGSLAWISLARLRARYRGTRPDRETVVVQGLIVVAFLLVTLAGVITAAAGYRGLVLLLPGYVAIFLYAVFNSWKMLAGAAMAAGAE
jgi:modulator of FtsH protease